MKPVSVGGVAGMAGRHAPRVVSAGLDLGLYAAGNFVLNVLLARSVSTVAYGAFTTVFAAYLLAAMLHEAFFAEPALVLGAKGSSDERPVYLASLLGAQAWIMLPPSLLVAAGTLVFLPPGAMRSTITAAALAAPFITGAQFVSRSAYLSARSWLPAVSSGVYFVTAIISGLVLHASDHLSPASAFIVLAVAGSTGAVPILVVHRLRRGDPGMTRATLIRHWEYGRWSVPSSVVRWAPSNLPLMAVSIWAGLSAASLVRSAALLTMPALLAISAVSLVILPHFSRLESATQVLRRARQLSIALVASGVVFVIGAGLVGSAVISAVLGPGYDPSVVVILMMAAIPGVTCVTAVFSAALRSLERPSKVFGSGVGALACTVCVGLPMVARFGTAGAAGSLLLSNLVLAAMTVAAAKGEE